MGSKRIGIAISDVLGILASPMLVLERSDEPTDIITILKLVEQKQVDCIIVGFPRSMDGTIGFQAEQVRSFGEMLKQKSPVPVAYRDERLTTVAAKQMLEETRKKKGMKGKKIAYDAAAAAIILQSFLNESKPLEWPSEETE